MKNVAGYIVLIVLGMFVSGAVYYFTAYDPPLVGPYLESRNPNQ